MIKKEGFFVLAANEMPLGREEIPISGYLAVAGYFAR